MRFRILCVSFLSLFLFSCAEKELSFYTMKGRVHGTYYTITYGTKGECLNDSSLQEVFSKFDLSLSTFEPNSIISRINTNDTTVVLDAYFEKVFERGMQVSEITNGAFDMTVAPLVNLWGFGFKKSDSVTPHMVDSIRSFTGYGKVRKENGRILKEDARIMLDASAIAKGYSSDVVAEFLESQNITNYMVEIGGEIVVSGKNSKGGDWHIGITQPTDDNSIDQPLLQTVIALSDCGLATSGNYRQFYYKDGKRYSHTINPSTGYPVEHNLLSASVIAPDCMTADAFATAFMVMGLDSAYALASEQEDMAAYFIYSDENNQLQVKYTKSFEKYLVTNQ